MEFYKIILILSYFLVFANADSVNGPNYPTNYVVPISGQLNLPTNNIPVSQQSVGINNYLGGINGGGVISSQNVNQYLAGVNSAGINGGIVTGLNGLSSTNGLLTGVNSLGTAGLNGLSGLTDIQTSEIIRRQIQTSNLNALNNGGVVNPLGNTVIGANGLPISTINNGINSLTTMNGLTAVIDRTTGATIGYVGANGIVTPVNAGINSLQNGYGNALLSGNNQVVNGPGGVTTIIDRTTGITVGYVGANGVVTPVTTTPNDLQTGYGNNLYPINNGYPVGNGLVGGINSLYPSTGVNGLNDIQTGYGNGLYPSSNNYQFVNGLDGTSTVIDRTTGVTVGYVGANGVVTPISTGINSLQNGYGNGYQFGGSINPLPNGLNTLYPLTGVTNQGITNGLTNTALNQYNSLIQNGYGSLYSSTMGTGLNGMNGYYPNTNGFGNGMNPYLGQQQFFGYNGYPFTGQQYGGYPLNGNSGSNSQASASSKSF